jgi:hypothetical protein
LPRNPTELLGTQRFGELVSTLRDTTDILLLDSPPLLPVSDLITMAPHADAGVLVVRTLWTPRHALKQTVAQFKRIGFRVLGAIANGASIRRGYYPHYYGYYAGRYSYAHAGETEDRSLRGRVRRMEKRFIEGLRDLRYSFPRLVVSSTATLKGLLSSPLVWVLSAILIGLLIAGSRLEARKEAETGGIQFVEKTGVGDIRATGPFDTPDPSDELSAAQSAQSVNDSLRDWSNALVRGNREELIRFYDPDFVYHQGDSSLQGSSAIRSVLSELSVDGIIVGSVGVTMVAPPECSTFALITFPEDSSVVRRLALSWRQDGLRWRITGQRWTEE